MRTFGNLSLNLFVYKDNDILCFFNYYYLDFFIVVALWLYPNVGLRLRHSFPSEFLKALYKRGQRLDPSGETEPVIVRAAEPI